MSPKQLVSLYSWQISGYRNKCNCMKHLKDLIPSVCVENYHCRSCSITLSISSQFMFSVVTIATRGTKDTFWLSAWFYLCAFNPRWAEAQLEILGLLWSLHSLSWRLLLFELFPSASLGTTVTCWGTQCPLKYFIFLNLSSSLFTSGPMLYSV